MRNHYTKNKRHKTSKNRRSKKYFAYLKRQRARAARIKVRKERHRKRHPKKETKYGFFILFARYVIERVKLREQVAKYVIFKKKPNSVFSVVDMIIGLTGLIVLGIPRIYHAAKYQQEKLIARALKLEHMFSGSTAYRFLNTFGLLTVCRALQKANASMVKTVWDSQEQIIVDGDPTTIRSYINQKEGACKGYNKLRPGRPCFQGTAYFANGFFVKSQVVAGNEVPLDSLTLFSHLEEVRRLCGRIDWIRLDAGHTSMSNLQGLDNFSRQGHSRLKSQYVVCIGSKGIGFAYALSTVNCRTWQKVKNGVFVQDISSIQIFREYEKEHRLIVVKRYDQIKQQWQHYGIVTNETCMGAVELYHFYHKRQTIESFFDEAKNSYHLEHLPCFKLYSNSLFFNILCLAFNLLALFRHDALRRQDRNIELLTFQTRYLSLDVVWDGQTLFIARSNPDYRLILAILHRLKKLNIALDYRFCG